MSALAEAIRPLFETAADLVRAALLERRAIVVQPLVGSSSFVELSVWEDSARDGFLGCEAWTLKVMGYYVNGSGNSPSRTTRVLAGTGLPLAEFEPLLKEMVRIGPDAIAARASSDLVSMLESGVPASVLHMIVDEAVAASVMRS